MSTELIVCGFAGVAILDVAEGRPREVWSWRAEACDTLPPHLRGEAFGATAECKPVRGGTQILIVSSLSGIALVERESKRAVFYAAGENAHSGTSSGGRLAVATSGPHPDAVCHTNPSQLIVYDAAAPERELYHTDLPWGHGVVWDEERHLLWALAISELRAYRLAAWESPRPSLELTFSLSLPESGAHDLSAIPGTPHLLLSTEHHCWLFDRDRSALLPHPQLHDASQVKSLSVHPVTGQVAYVQAEEGTWWAHEVRFLNPEAVLELPEKIVYKARWNVARNR